MDDWRLQGLGKAVPWKQALFLRKGSTTKETKSQRMENGGMKFQFCVQAVEEAAGQNFLKSAKWQ